MADNSPRWDNLWAKVKQALTWHLALKVLLGFITSAAAGYASVIWYCLAEGVPVFDMLDVTGAGVVLVSSLAWLSLLAITLILLMPGIARLLDPVHHHPDAGASDRVKEHRTHFRWLLAVVPGTTAYSCTVMPMFTDAAKLEGAEAWMEGARLAFVLIIGFALLKSMFEVRRSSGGQGCWREARTGWGYFLLMNAATMFWMFIYTLVTIELLAGFHEGLPQTPSLSADWRRILELVPFVFLPMAPGFLMVSSMGWAVHRRGRDVAMAATGILLFCVFVWPTAPHVVERTLNRFSMGGGRQVALWVDPHTACSRHPALLPAEACPSRTGVGRIRLAPRPLALRGREAYLVWLDEGPSPEWQGRDRRRAAVAIPRAEVHDVEYLRDGSDRSAGASDRRHPPPA